MLCSGHIEASPRELWRSEETLLAGCQASHLIWTGRGASALYLAYRVIRAKRGPGAEIIFPAISCKVPADVALLAGLTPRFADIDPTTGLATFETIKRVATEKTAAVVFIHLYGHTAELEPLAHWCHSRHITLIEDAALALGARLPDGRRVGSIGDMMILSFGSKKILECGGGALLLRSDDDLQILRSDIQQSSVPETPASPEHAALTLEERNVQYEIITALRNHHDIGRRFYDIRSRYHQLYFTPLPDVRNIASNLEQLPAVLADRLLHAERFAQTLRNAPAEPLLGWQISGTCWRFCFLVPDPAQQIPLSEAIRRDGFDVSNHYWPVNQYLRPDDPCPMADQFARRIVNLWVDSTVTNDRVLACSTCTLKHLVEMNP